LITEDPASGNSPAKILERKLVPKIFHEPEIFLKKFVDLKKKNKIPEKNQKNFSKIF